MSTPAIENSFESEGWDRDELSEMKSLLQQAEQRLRKPELASKHTIETISLYVYMRRLKPLCTGSDVPTRLPKLNPGPITQPYIISTGGIARADRTRLVDDGDWNLAARRVDDPVKVKKITKKVGNTRNFPFLPKTKKYIQMFLTQSHRTCLGYTLCIPESHIIVTRTAFLPHELFMYISRKT